MNLLVINLDKAIFSENSKSLERLKEYSQLVDKMFVIVWTQKREQPIVYEDKLFIYPTNSASKLKYYFDTFKIAKKILAGDKIDLIFTQDPFETGLAGWLLARKFKLPLQLQIHTDIFSPYFWKESISNKLRVLLAKFLIPRANCLRVVSERIARSLYFTKVRAAGSSFFESASEPTRRRREGLRCEKNELPVALSKKINVLPIFVDVEKIKNAPIKADLRKKYPRFDFIILMASRFGKEKNIGIAIEAIYNAKNKLNANHAKNIGLIIVGAGPERKNYELRIKNYGLEKNVIIEGWCDDLISYYKTADLFLLTSNYEGYGMTAVEALAAGCSVIMTDVGCAGSVVNNGENGIVIPVGDKEKLTEAIVDTVINDRQINGFLTPVITKEQYLDVYKKSWESCIMNES